MGSTDSGGVERMLTDWHFGFGYLELENRRYLKIEGGDSGSKGLIVCTE